MLNYEAQPGFAHPSQPSPQQSSTRSLRKEIDISLNFNDKPFPRQITSPVEPNKMSSSLQTRSPRGGNGGAPVASVNFFPTASKPGLLGTLASSRSNGALTNTLNDSISTINASQLYPAPASGAQTSNVDLHIVITDLKKEMRKKEQEHQKQTAILKQQVQLLELQAREHEQNQIKMKQMHESMLNAVRQEGSGHKNSNSMSSAMEQIRDEYEEKLAAQSKEIQMLRDQLKEKDYDYQNVSLQMESKEIDYERKVQDLQLDKRNLDNKIKRLQNQLGQVQKPQELEH